MLQESILATSLPETHVLDLNEMVGTHYLPGRACSKSILILAGCHQEEDGETIEEVLSELKEKLGRYPISLCDLH